MVTESHYGTGSDLRYVANASSFSLIRPEVACTIFLRLAAEYLLSLGAHGDAARLYCMSWLRGDRNLHLSLHEQTFENFYEQPVSWESILVEGGWPLAHELGHMLGGDDTELPGLLDSQIDTYLEHLSTIGRSFELTPESRARLLSELLADYYGAELILRTLTATGVSTHGLYAVLDEFCASMWALMLMESAKTIFKAAYVGPEAGEAAMRRADRQATTTHDLRRRLLYNSILADISGWGWPDPAHFEIFSERIMTDFVDAGSPMMAEWNELQTGLGLAVHTAQGRPSPMFPWLVSSPLECLDPEAPPVWDPPLAEVAAMLSKYEEWHYMTRSFVNRARATNNSLGQSTELLDHLDNLARHEIPRVQPRRLSDDEKIARETR